ncbi:hypothetical protein D3877_25270 [Azospirillum cavernae]|uniref:Methyltransferase type 11 domain-containing protein n=1 Tax=Azospirillum cavernae TaxID=2320860 RepID=A0A418VQ64_9PROT|nr:hypothetical protein [Azospirillum cavernae]RJF78400.1 hypothetical protein D3877_25270 [Azospirillum cavernae]
MTASTRHQTEPGWGRCDQAGGRRVAGSAVESGENQRRPPLTAFSAARVTDHRMRTGAGHDAGQPRLWRRQLTTPLAHGSAGVATRTIPPGWFDSAVLLESLCHVSDKGRLLALLRETCGRLVARVNGQDEAPPGTAFGDTMRMIDSATQRQTVEAAGWRIRHWRDRRREAVPSVAAWARRLRAIPATEHGHIETLRAWCAHVADDPKGWGEANPLIELAAD